jgi:hypothetical protein
MSLIPVRELLHKCSLQVRNFDRGGLAASDNCNRSATTGVLFEKHAIIGWRCDTHMGVRRFPRTTWELGAVVSHVPDSWT